MDDNQSPLTMSEAVQAYTQGSGGRNPDIKDNPPEVEDEGQEAPDEEISDDDLAEGLAEEDEDNPEQEEGDGTPEEPEEKPDEEEYAAGRFAADNAKTRLADGTVTTIAELKQGNLLQSDYSRKTLALAEERKTVEETKANFAAVEQAIAQQRETLAMIVNRKLPKPPDLAMLNPRVGDIRRGRLHGGEGGLRAGDERNPADDLPASADAGAAGQRGGGRTVPAPRSGSADAF